MQNHDTFHNLTSEQMMQKVSQIFLHKKNKFLENFWEFQNFKTKRQNVSCLWVVGHQGLTQRRDLLHGAVRARHGGHACHSKIHEKSEHKIGV